MDLFREVMYTLLGLMMNLCLQSPFVSEVWHPFLPTWNNLNTFCCIELFSFSQRKEKHRDSNPGRGNGQSWMDALSLCSAERGTSHSVGPSSRKLTECPGGAEHGARFCIYKVR